ncbi:DUF2797 domain-containing protein [bacterium]|nr:DUF2797 domain-containing protein [bacterium]
MRVAPGADGAEASYALADGFWNPEERVADHPLNLHLGEDLQIEFTGRIACVYCGRESKKSFGQGFCYPCFQARAEADVCIVKPELCHYFNDADPCRDDAFARSHCFQPHVLYVALTSGLKVGITRRENIPTRWLDQGATAAIPLAELPDRRTVGLLEAELRERAGLADRTHWTALLKNERGDGDLAAHAAGVAALLADRGIALLPPEERRLHEFRFPVRAYPTKVKSFNLDKDPHAGGVLQGIKGQYLIFDAGVINLRKYTGYEVVVSVG